MQFDSWSAFFSMGGYAFYVWLAYGVSGLCLVGLLLDCVLKRRQVFRSVLLQQQRQARQQAASKGTQL